MLHKYLAIVLLTFIVGCVGLNDTTALIKKGDWTAIGERDGMRGLPSRSIADLDKLALSAGVESVNLGNYETGYNTGIERYCDVGNAYEIGLSGMQYLGVCAYKSDGLRFQMQWQRGYDYFQAGDSSF